MWTVVRTTLAPLLSLLLLMVGSGLFNTFVSIRLEIEGYGPEVIGMVTSALYMGILAGSLRMDRWISWAGHSRALIVIALTLSALVLLQSLWLNPWYWSLLRFVGGICTAGVFIVIESWLLMMSPPNLRGGILSVYLAVLYSALSLGQLLIDVSDLEGQIPFFITSFFVALSALPILLKKPTQPAIEKSVRLTLAQLYRISPLGFIGGIISGMVSAVTHGLVPIYAKEVGLSLSGLGAFMAILILGGVSLQWPLGRLADRTDRRKVIYIVSFVTALIALAIVFIKPLWLLLFFAWGYGGFAFTLYPISMAYACEKVKETEIVAATGGFVLSYGIGAILGPLIAPIGMEYFGPSAIFYFIATITALLGFIGLKKPAEAVTDD